SVLCSAAARLAARFTEVVVLPTPPFWFATAKITGEDGGTATGSYTSPPAPATQFLAIVKRISTVPHMSLNVGVGGCQCATQISRSGKARVGVSRRRAQPRRPALPSMNEALSARHREGAAIDRILAASFWCPE